MGGCYFEWDTGMVGGEWREGEEVAECGWEGDQGGSGGGWELEEQA